MVLACYEQDSAGSAPYQLRPNKVHLSNGIVRRVSKDGEKLPPITFSNEERYRQFSFIRVSIRRTTEEDSRSVTCGGQIGGLNCPRTPEVTAENENQVSMARRFSIDDRVPNEVKQVLPFKGEERQQQTCGWK